MDEGERDAGEPRYTAFLSYSHKDAAAAGKLHRRLETYRIPKRLVGAETPHGIVPERLWPIFRDRDELPAATDLSETVREALAQSGALIILCSPHAADSLWVAEEIDVFRRLHPDRPILAAILDGDPPDCFPAKLRAFGQDGTWHEPLATDLRRQADGAHLGLLKLVAGITGVGLDALVQRDAARRIRRVTMVSVAALTAMLLMAALAWFALDARREAERQRVEARRLAEFMHTDLRDKLSNVGRLDIMRAVNGEALAYYDRQLQRYDRPADRLMRARILQALGEDDLARGDMRAALRQFTSAHGITSALLADAPNDAERIFGHGQSEYWLGYHAYMQGNLAAARARFNQYKQLADRLVETNRNHWRWLREAGYAEGNLCSLDVQGVRRLAVVPRSCNASLVLMSLVHQRRPADPKAVRDLANRHAWIADAWNLMGRWDRVRAHRTRQEALIGSLLEREPRNRDYQDFWMRTQFTFACLLVEHRNRREAQSRFDDAAATARSLLEHDSENANWKEWRQKTAAREAGCPSD